MPQLVTNAEGLSGCVKHRLISKPQYRQGLQCPKLLWHAVNTPHHLPESSALADAVFDQSREVRRLAQRLFPGGIEAGGGMADLQQTVTITQEAISLRRPLFEAAFASRMACVHCDIVNPVGGDQWDLFKVTASTVVKSINVHDLSFQVRVLRDAGTNVRKLFLVYINTDFVRQGNIDPEQFFMREEVTDLVDGLLPAVDDNLGQIQEVVRLGDAPEVAIGEHCDNPRTCPLRDRCRADLPEDNVFTLARIGAKAFKLFDQGITHIRDIPAGFKLSPIQELQRQAVVTGEPHVDNEAVAAFLERLTYPLYHLDFETFAPTIPIFEGDGPFEQIPFQFSLHIQPMPGAIPERVMFLAAGTGDPRRLFLERLRTALGDHGSIVVYNAHFEKGVLSRCAARLPEFEPWVTRVKHRVVDLLTPFKTFRVYHPYQRGSASLKAVLPAWTGHGYEELEIREGGTASAEFVRVTFSDVPAAERQQVRRQLEVYCGRDTEAMVWLVDVLMNLAAAH